MLKDIWDKKNHLINELFYTTDNVKQLFQKTTLSYAQRFSQSVDKAQKEKIKEHIN